MVFGLFLIVFGSLYLLNNLGIIAFDIWGYFWPAIIIAFGVSMVFGHKKKHPWCCWPGDGEKKKKGK